MTQLKETTLRSQVLSGSSCSKETAKEFLLPGSICAIAADAKSTDTIWFVYIVDVEEALDDKLDSYGHAIPPGHMYVRARYLERMGDTNKGQKYKLMSKEVFLYKESIVYPFVNMEQKKDHYFISKSAFYDVLTYAEQSGMCSI